ncbi:lysozyme inhibitor LprI family protein [Rhizobium sp.]
MKISLFAAAIIIASSGLAFAQEDPPVDCANAQTQADMNQCAYQDFEKADEELNAVYKQAVKAATDSDKEAAEMGDHYVGAVAELKKAQRAWIDYRDGHCDGMSREALGGSMQPMLISGCQSTMTQARTKELRELIATLAGG